MTKQERAKAIKKLQRSIRKFGDYDGSRQRKIDKLMGGKK